MFVRSRTLSPSPLSLSRRIACPVLIRAALKPLPRGMISTDVHAALLVRTVKVPPISSYRLMGHYVFSLPDSRYQVGGGESSSQRVTDNSSLSSESNRIIPFRGMSTDGIRRMPVNVPVSRGRAGSRSEIRELRIELETNARYRSLRVPVRERNAPR